MSLLPIVHGGITAGGGFTAATGGTITTDGDFKVHTFNSSGTFQVTAAGAGTVEYLVIAGGGSGGSFFYGGEAEQAATVLQQIFRYPLRATA